MKKYLSAICALALLPMSASAGAPKYPAGGVGGSAVDLVSGLVRVETTIIPAAQLRGSDVSPQTIVPAPGAGWAIVLDNISVWYAYAGTAYGGIAGGEDLAIGYEDKNGTQVAEIETVGFLDQATSQFRTVVPHSAASGSNTAVPLLENKPLVAFLLSGPITTGNTDLRLKIFYHVVPTTW